MSSKNIQADLGLTFTQRGIAVGTRAIDRLASAHDASHYLLTPELVLTPTSALDVASIFEIARESVRHVTFRSGGTSLSGQASTNGLLVDTRMNFRTITVVDEGAKVRCEPGATVRQVNARLARHKRKIGPDPASEIACTIGGVVANNSSGMVCGTTQNTYRTLESAVIVLPSGTIIDTSLPDSDKVFRAKEPALYLGLLELRERVRNNPESVKTIQQLYSIKNTMGYGLNSFLDFDTPVEILEHLVIGSEGTLAFVAEATFATVPLKAKMATALLIFSNLHDATSSLSQLVAAGFAAIELLDSASLLVAQGDPEATPDLRELKVVDHAALLVEFQEMTDDELSSRVKASVELLASLPLVAPAELSTDPKRRASLWHIRKGLYTLVAGARPSGTTALLEDIAVPVENLYQTCIDLIELMDSHGYEQSVIFGHAKDGNIHFMLNERFDDPASLKRYKEFTDDMVDLVLKHRGTLKAEHGTGRIMAPYVERQYGAELYEVMKQVKKLFDPSAMLNPGILLSDDPEIHFKHLKITPTVEAEVDRCVECGYCEPACPSKNITLTPRKRIVLRREIERARELGDNPLVAELLKDYTYEGVETCAVDGMCETACPVLINTGDLVRRLRSEAAGSVSQSTWNFAAKHWDAITSMGGTALTITDVFPTFIPKSVTDAARAILGKETVPQYSADLPKGGKRRPTVHSVQPEAVYFSSCTTTMFGAAEDGVGVSDAFLQLCQRAGINLTTPPNLPSLCCGTPWKSKGLTEGYASMKVQVVESLRVATRNGELPVVCDAASCSEGLEVLLKSAQEEGIRVIDSVEFVASQVLNRLPQVAQLESLTLHPTCSSTRMDINDSLHLIASTAARDVIVPTDWSCCAFAGDRGMLHPELTASATIAEAAEAISHDSTAYASLNRTCELGMTRATGKSYRHILEVLEEQSR